MKAKYILLSAAILLAGSSCKKYLAQAPDQRTQINSVTKVKEILGTAYTQADYATFFEAASDNAEDKGINVGSLSPENQDAYNWVDVRSRDQGSPTFFWYQSYAAIAAANAALDAISKAEDQTAYLPYKGEALVARAYAHFMLALIFAKPYEAGGKNDAPGIPYVTASEKVVFKDYDRGTVAETWDKIEKDLLEGMPLLKNSAYAVEKYHFNVAAADAFAARFYLFKKQYDKVVQYASAAFPGNSFKDNLRPWNTIYHNSSANELQIMFPQASQKCNLLITEAPSVWARNYAGYRYGLGFSLNSAQSTRMVTGTSFDAESMYVLGTAPAFALLKQNEFFVRSSPNANIGDPYTMMIQFTADELLMNRAEAYANLGQNSLALADINTFASTRIQDYSATTNGVTLEKIATFYGISDPKQGLIQTILDFKKREFIQEGLRWFDIIRLDLPVEHNVKAQNNSDSYVTLPPGDPRRLFQLPEEVALANIPLNPR